jgi:hypothetical protein
VKRRTFITAVSTGCVGFSLFPNGSLLNAAMFDSEPSEQGEFARLTKQLLVDWCDGMLRRQISEPGNPDRHGALSCPGTGRIHGRCADALYPFLHMGHVGGDQKYVDAAINVYQWAENNVSQPDGSWSNDMNPKSWRGTTIFGAIALAEALHYHGEVLADDMRTAWMERLDRAAGGYLWTDFKEIDFTNLNYGMTALYGFHLFGEVLNKSKYTERSEQFAARAKEFFTEPNKLLWGEGKPNNNRSGRGLLPVDLGYNVEESLNGVALYALAAKDDDLMKLVTESRSAKWTYWGSRTSDGCQPAFSFLADRNPAFATAALKNAQLLQQCTSDGLLHGGPHYVSHGIKPCIHHTFAHAKVMALVQDRLHSIPKVEKPAPLPRQSADGVKHFPELDVWLAARGPWRATVSAYDSIYKTKSADHIQQPTGGSLSMLYHEKVGPLLASSMARYILVEYRNMQPQPADDFPLTTRVESRVDGKWYTNLHDLKADVSFTDDGKIIFDIKTSLQDEDRNPTPGGGNEFVLKYVFDESSVTISAAPVDGSQPDHSSSLIVPIISPSGEQVMQESADKICVAKPGGTVCVESNAPLSIMETEKGRVFNMVPGMEAVPVIIPISKESGWKAECKISVV